MLCMHTLTTVLPCSDLDARGAFNAKLEFTHQGRANNHRMREAH